MLIFGKFKIEELEKCLFYDGKLLGSLLGVEIKSFSYHNTTPQLLTE